MLTLLAVVGGSAMAQSNVSINGTVTDQTGAVIPNATITVTSNQTGLVRSAKADSDGHYAVLNIPPGFYDLRATMTGFTTVERHHQEFLVGTTVTVDFPLSVSATEMTVEVQAVSPEIERTQSDIVNVLDTKQLDDLPILSRNFSELASLTPGVQSTSQTSVGFAVGGAVTGVTVGNSTQYATGYTIDNIPITKPSDGGLYVAIAQDWVQEFSVVANQSPAEYAGAVSGYVNTITRSGGNSIHGRAYSFFQNSALNASATNPVTPITSKAPSSSQRVGGMIGGPALKSKLFYFAGYEYFRSLSGVIFSGLPASFAGTRSVLPADLTGANISNLNRQDLAELKLTYQMNQKNSIDLLGNLQSIGEPNIAAGGAVAPENGATTHFGGYQESINWTHLFSPTAINSLRFATARNWDDETCTYANQVGPYPGTAPALTQYGTTVNGNPTGYYAQLTYPGAIKNDGVTPAGNVTVGCAGRFGGKHFLGLYGGFYETYTMTKGRHEIKIGGQAADPYYGSNQVHSNSDGLYTFPTSQAGPFDPNNVNTYPQQLTMNWGPLNHSYVMATGWSFGLFAQDTWRATDNLTINTGIRWDGDLSYSYFNSHGLAPDGQPVNNDMRTVAPQIGMSWAPLKDKSTLIRGGFGLYYGPTPLTEVTGYVSQRTNPVIIVGFTSNSPTSNPYCTGAPVCTTALQNDLKELMAYSLYNNTFPDLSLKSVSVGAQTYTLPGFTGTIPKSGVYNIDSNLRKAASMQTTAGVSHDFHDGFTATADFAYSYGFDLDLERNVNINPFQPLSPSGSINYLNSNYTSEYSTGSLGWYKSKQLLTKLRYRDHRGDFAQVSYTLSYATSNSPGTQDFTLHAVGVYSTNPFDLSVDNGPANTDQRHYIAINANTKLPFGIEFAPIFTFGTGLPLAPTTTQQSGAAPITVALPNGRTNIVTVPGCQKWYNQCYPAINGVLMSKGSIRGANTVSFSGRLQRSIKLGRERSLTPMFEVYNIPNHVNYGSNYQVQATSAAFDLPSNTSITMRQMQLGIRFDF